MSTVSASAGTLFGLVETAGVLGALAGVAELGALAGAAELGARTGVTDLLSWAFFRQPIDTRQQKTTEQHKITYI